ncbi:MAG: hypothetical protein M3Q58_04070 [Bacteroidota bacterium]|nr:hypothetical protein [Bacteroidota bacterium]
MNHFKFKTNINCQNCVDSVSTALESDKRIFAFNVDTNDPDKLLTVEGELESAEVIIKVGSVGFDAEEIPYNSK